MGKNFRNKFVPLVACASVLSSKTLAMSAVKFSSQEKKLIVRFGTGAAMKRYKKIIVHQSMGDILSKIESEKYVKLLLSNDKDARKLVGEILEFINVFESKQSVIDSLEYEGKCTRIADVIKYREEKGECKLVQVKHCIENGREVENEIYRKYYVFSCLFTDVKKLNNLKTSGVIIANLEGAKLKLKLKNNRIKFFYDNNNYSSYEIMKDGNLKIKQVCFDKENGYDVEFIVRKTK